MRIGIDIGGTKTEIICLHSENGKELYKQRVPTPNNDYHATVQNVANMVHQAEDTLGQKGTVGVCIPGTVSRVTGKVKNANSVWLNGQPFDADLGEAMQREVRIQNDANCFTVSEATDGAAAGKEVVFGVIIGTGCGGGLAINGKPVSGINGIGGEWGHNPLPYPKLYRKKQQKQDDWPLHNPIAKDQYEKNASERELEYFVFEEHLNEFPGPKCYCGRQGCMETWISGPAFKNDYNRVTGEDLSTHDIINKAVEGDQKAKEALARYVDRMARGLAVVINSVDPDMIVLGGGMSNVDALYEDVPQAWKKYIFSDTIDTKLAPPRHGDSSGVRGAAWLWNDDQDTQTNTRKTA